jgi:hypothetical protein
MIPEFNRTYDMVPVGATGCLARSLTLNQTFRLTTLNAKKLGGVLSYPLRPGLLPGVVTQVILFDGKPTVISGGAVYQFSETEWTRLGTRAGVNNLFFWGTTLVADCGSNGVWGWSGTAWVRYGTISLTRFHVWLGTLYGATTLGGSSNLFYSWNGAAWSAVPAMAYFGYGGITQMVDWAGTPVILGPDADYVDKIFMWTGSAWAAMGSTTGTPLYDWAGTLLSGCRQWNGSAWVTMGDGATPSAFCVWDSKLIRAAGDGVSSWSGSAWERIGQSFFSGGCYDCNGELVVGCGYAAPPTLLPIGAATLIIRESDSHGVIQFADGTPFSDTTFIGDLLDVAWVDGTTKTRSLMIVIDIDVVNKRLELIMGSGQILPAVDAALTSISANVSYVARYNDTDGWR